MLKVPSPFPQVGSYALLVDQTLPITQQRAELVRIMRRPTICDRGGDVAVAFPLRIGASGSRLVDDAQLVDGTPLTREEERELADLQHYVAGRDRPNKAKAARCDALRSRLIMSGVMKIELDKLARLQARQQPSTGGLLPRSEAA